MKNKKTIIFTVGIISAFIVLMVAGSKVFTGYMGYLDEAENTLTVDTENTDYETVFDYPYIKLEELDDNSDCAGYSTYKNYEMNLKRTVKYWDENPDVERYITLIQPDENMISLQEVANKYGEYVKYLYGITYPTKAPAMIFYEQRPEGEKLVKYMISESYGVDPNKKFNLYNGYIEITADAYTGKIISFLKPNEYPINITIDTNNNFFGTKKEVTDSDKEKLNSLIKNDLEILGFEDVEIFEEYAVRGLMGYYKYTINVVLTNGEKLWIAYHSADGENFELAQISHR